KTMFVKEILLDNPLANSQTVNGAWSAAGMEGSISHTLVSQVRAQLGLRGNLRGRRRKGRKGTGTAELAAERGTSPERDPSGANGMSGVKVRGRKSTLINLEVDLDRLLFRVMDVGDLPEVEDALRKARRLLYAGSTTPS